MPTQLGQNYSWYPKSCWKPCNSCENKIAHRIPFLHIPGAGLQPCTFNPPEVADFPMQRSEPLIGTRKTVKMAVSTMPLRIPPWIKQLRGEGNTSCFLHKFFGKSLWDALKYLGKYLKIIRLVFFFKKRILWLKGFFGKKSKRVSHFFKKAQVAANCQKTNPRKWCWCSETWPQDGVDRNEHRVLPTTKGDLKKKTYDSLGLVCLPTFLGWFLSIGKMCR